METTTMFPINTGELIDPLQPPGSRWRLSMPCCWQRLIVNGHALPLRPVLTFRRSRSLSILICCSISSYRHLTSRPWSVSFLQNYRDIQELNATNDASSSNTSSSKESTNRFLQEEDLVMDRVMILIVFTLIILGGCWGVIYAQFATWTIGECKIERGEID